MLMAHVENQLTFSCPVVTGKHYIVKGPSGWTETFKRSVLDPELELFLAPAPVVDMVNLFITAREISETKEITGWFTVTGFLSRTLGLAPKAIPPTIAVAFWGQVVVETRARNAN